MSQVGRGRMESGGAKICKFASSLWRSFVFVVVGDARQDGVLCRPRPAQDRLHPTLRLFADDPELAEASMTCEQTTRPSRSSMWLQSTADSSVTLSPEGHWERQSGPHLQIEP